MQLRGVTLAPADMVVGGLCCATLGVAGLGAATGLEPDGPPICAWRLATGVPCPFCGMTRSVAALGRGDLETSVAMHPLGVVVVPLAAALLVAIGLAVRRGGQLRWRLDVVAAALVALTVVWIHTLTVGEVPPA